MRQRNARQKPLYLIDNSQWSGGTGRRNGLIRQGLVFRAGDRGLLQSMTGLPFSPAILCRQG